MRTTCLAAAVAVFVVILAAGSGAAEKSMDARVLDRWLGNWKHHVIVKPAAWSLVGVELRGTSTAEWILSGRYQQVSSMSGDKETREIHRFDADSGQFHKWAFDSDGGHSFWVGAWDGKSGTMTWKYMDFGVGVEGEIINRFTGVDKYETTLVLRDSQGNELLDIRSQHTRIGD